MSSKTKEGSNAGILSTLFVYYLVLQQIHPNGTSLFLVFFFATLGASLVEGLTVQFDNLVCSVGFFVFLHWLHDYFWHLV